MKERTKEQDECVKFYHNVNKINEEMAKYQEAMSMMLTAENRMKNLPEHHDHKVKYATARSVYEDRAEKALEAATTAYRNIVS